MRRSLLVCALALSTLFALSFARADIQLNALFSDDMILQRDKPVPVWGVSAPREKVSVSIGTQVQSTQADDNGDWKIILNPMPTATALVLRATGEKNGVALKNVAVGDVYLCSGQSNMEWPVEKSNNAEAEIKAAIFPNIRFFTVPKKITTTPQSGFASPPNGRLARRKALRGFRRSVIISGASCIRN